MSHIINDVHNPSAASLQSEAPQPLDLVIEVQDREHKQLQKQLLTSSNSIHIGRSWQSDVIVQDECVDATHLTLSLADNGQVLLADSSTENGVFVTNKRIKGPVAYQFGDVIRIGSTTLRVFDASEQVKPALPVSIWQSWSRRLSSKLVLLGVTVLAMVCFILQALMAQGQEFRLSAFLPTVFAAGLFLFVWSLLMSFVGRLFRHEANAKAHWGFGCLLISVGIVVGYFLEIIDFNVPSPLLRDINENIWSAVIIAVLVYGTLSFTSFLTHRTKLVWAVLLSILPAIAFFIMPLFDEEHEQWSAWVQSETFAMPPAFLLRQAQPLDEYMVDANRLFEGLAAQVDDAQDGLK